ncbi:cyclase family protein [Candidatus Uhrbacteria bacterium]|nr:cyclase family protein [Candidatus Uhrbacteria bacterium]
MGNKLLNIIDLTHPLTADMPTWDGRPGFDLSVKLDYKDCVPPDLFRTQKIKCSAGIGTHIDAPAHMILGGRTVDQLTLEELTADCVVIDVSSEARADYVVTQSIVERFEREHGTIIPPHSVVIFYTGWDKYWTTPKKYNNRHRFPSVDTAAAELLIRRGVAGLGIDTLSADRGDNGFPVHRAILGADKYLLENVANARLLPYLGAKILVLPTKIKGATEAPVRLIALI